MKYQVQIKYINPAHEHVSLRRRVETITRLVEASSEEEALNRAANQQRALGFMIQEANIVTVEQSKPAPVIIESKQEEMDDDSGQEDDDEMDDEEDDDEEDDLKEGIAADMFAARREKAQKKIADMLLKRDMEATKKERLDKRQAGTMKPVKESVEYIEEKLTAADPAAKWISDFVKSDNPKFAGKSKKERINQALGAYYAAKRGKVEEGFDPEPSDIAAYLVDKHGKGKVTKDHVDAYERNRDSSKAIDKEAVMKHVQKMSEEVESVEEGVATAQKVMDRAKVVANTNPDPKKRFAASGLAQKAMLRTINPTGVNTGITRGGGNKTYRMVTGKVPPYQLTKKTGVSEEVEQVDEVTTRVVNKEVKTEKDEKSTKAAETMINLAKSKKNKVNAKPTLDLTGSEKKYVTKV